MFPSLCTPPPHLPIRVPVEFSSSTYLWKFPNKMLFICARGARAGARDKGFPSWATTTAEVALCCWRCSLAAEPGEGLGAAASLVPAGHDAAIAALVCPWSPAPQPVALLQSEEKNTSSLLIIVKTEGSGRGLAKHNELDTQCFLLSGTAWLLLQPGLPPGTNLVGTLMLQLPLSLVSWDFAAIDTFSFGIPADILASLVLENEK